MPQPRRERSRKPGRRTPFREPKPVILVVCEGRKTEPQYLLGLREASRNPRVDIKVVSHKGGAPIPLVEQAIRLQAEARERARRERDVNAAYDQVWCVFDVDGHDGQAVRAACAKAHAAGIELAVSNPCFELWLILHFKESPGPQTCRTLRSLLPKEVRSHGKSVRFEEFAPGQRDAVRRAERLDRVADEAGESGRNPTTGVYRLACAIEDGGKRGRMA